MPAIDSGINLLVFGSILGLICGRLCLIGSGLVFGPSALASLLAFSVITGAALLLATSNKFVQPSLKWTVDDSRELAWILGLSSVVLLGMALAYWGVGHLTPKGFAFVPNFGWDLFNHITCGAELARRLPPENPYFAGQPLHYYWFFHLWPASLITLTGTGARDALIATIPPTSLLFIASLSCLLRTYVAKLAPRMLALGLGLFAFSYIGIFYVLRVIASSVFASISSRVNTDYSFLSHSWFRDFLYEPHAVTALTGLCFLLYLERTPNAGPRIRSASLAGLLLGAISITDLFIGLIGLLWFGLCNLGRFVKSKESRLPIIVESSIACAIIICAFALRLFPSPSGSLRLGIHSMTKYAPVYLLVELGPIFVFGLAGLYLAARRGRIRSFASLLILLSLSSVIAFTLIVDLVPNQVIRKSIKVVQIPLVVLAADACVMFLARPSRDWVRLAGYLIILAGFSTLVTDIIQYRDIEADRKPATAYISQDKMQALEWIRRHTEPNAIVQLIDEVRPGRKIRENSDMSVPAFAERRTLFGNYEFIYVMHVSELDAERRKEILEKVFTAKDSVVLEENLNLLPSHYIIVDDSEPGPKEALNQLKKEGLLQEVFHSGHMSILSRAKASG